MPADSDFKQFKEKIWNFYRHHKRSFPWRQTTNLYKILISEVMLQQTQTERVLPKYESWIKRFPDFQTLAQAPLSEILKYWKGLGYNRRALYLKEIAHSMSKLKDKNITKIQYFELLDFLQKLPGIGENTAAAIVVFVYNKPLVFIETNIRRVFIHEFFSDATIQQFNNQKTIHDNQLMPLIEQTFDRKNPRQWYYALMDYGSMLGQTIENPNRKSVHYAKQSKFEGSLRQVRGKILSLLTSTPTIRIVEAKKILHIKHEEQFEKALRELEKEGFITRVDQAVWLNP